MVGIEAYAVWAIICWDDINSRRVSSMLKGDEK